MKNIYLIGDSIRFGSVTSPGYEIYVKEKLDESYYADWTHPNEKGAKILADVVIKSIEGACKL